MRTIIAGGRDFNDFYFMNFMLLSHHITTVISGHAPGADQMGERWSFEVLKKDPEIYKANWAKYGRWQAGFIRNEFMAAEVEAEQCIVFWDGVSTGSSDMIDRARKHKLKLQIYFY